jgi:hypothetical protein
VQKPIETYSTLSTTTSKIFSSTEPFILFGCVNKNACGGELGRFSLQSSSSKHKARHFVLTKLDLDTVAELTPRNKKLYNMIRTSPLQAERDVQGKEAEGVLSFG